MSFPFTKNAVFRWHGGKRFRILWVHPREQRLAIFHLDDEKALPELVSRREIEAAIARRELFEALDDLLPKPLKRGAPSEAAVKVRDNAWSLIGEIVSREPEIYYPRDRGKLIAEVIASKGGSRPTIYKHLRRFWRHGCVAAALLGEFPNCGAPGVERRIHGPKRGCPRRMTPGVGVNVTPEMRKEMRQAASRVLLHRKGGTFSQAYDFLLLTSYSKAVRIVRHDNGRYKVKIMDPDGIPTLEQFRYWVLKDNNRAAMLIHRLGPRKMEQRYKPLESSSLAHVRGPGSRYEIDATIVDVYLVSRLDRNLIIGRPTLYIVVDVFSRMIVGIYVGLDKPSWKCAGLALINAASDKTEFCRRYGIELEEGEWPVAQLPAAILGDRGEMASSLAEVLPELLNVSIELGAPYRGDAKGTVESKFRTLHADLGNYFPGFILPDYRERGGRDYRLDAKLTIDEFTAVVIALVLSRNQQRRRDYPGDPQIVADGTPYVPLALWNWGREHCRDDGRKFSENYVRRALLPRAKVTVTRKGLRLATNLYYTSEAMKREPWYVAAQERREVFWANYHPGDISTIHVLSNDQSGVEYEAHLVDRCSRFDGVAYVEAEAFGYRERQIAAEDKVHQTETRLGYTLHVNEVVEKAEHAAALDHDPSLSNAERTRGIQRNNQAEKRLLAAEEATSLGFGDLPPPSLYEASVEPDPDDATEQNLIAKMRDRKHNRSKNS